jgi:hypothetical protein
MAGRRSRLFPAATPLRFLQPGRQRRSQLFVEGKQELDALPIRVKRLGPIQCGVGLRSLQGDSNLPQPGDRISIKGQIGADDEKPLAHGLSHDEPVERIAVMER